MYQRRRYKKNPPPPPSESVIDGEVAPIPHERESKPRRSARARLMDLLARRNYSPTEIRLKLGEDYPENEIEAAIEFARESRWLIPEDEMAKQVASSLSRKKKGHRYVQQYLRNKGLPPITKDSEAELENSLALVRSKFARTLASGQTFDYECQKKAQRLLFNRGFDEATIRNAIQIFVRELAQTTTPK
jgi:regulatory protein